MASGPAVTPRPRRARAAPRPAGWRQRTRTRPGRRGRTLDHRWTAPLTSDAAAAGAGGALLAGPATAGGGDQLAAVRATVPVTALVTAGTALADVAVAGGVAGAGAGGPVALGLRSGGLARRRGTLPWVRLWVVWLTLASAPPAGDWPGPLPGAPDGACPGGVLAAGPVLDPPDPPGKMSWVTPPTADTAALVTGALVTGALAAGALAAWGGGLVRGAAGPGGGAGRWPRERPERRQRWQRVPGWPVRARWQRLGWAAEAGLAGGCGAGGWAAEDGPWLPPLPGAGVLPGAGGGDSGPRQLPNRPRKSTLPAGRPAVSPLTPAAAAGPEGCAEPGFCAGAGFWSADTPTPARSTAKTSAAAKPPHAYRQTLKASLKARERVADPFTANTVPPVARQLCIFFLPPDRV